MANAQPAVMDLIYNIAGRNIRSGNAAELLESDGSNGHYQISSLISYLNISLGIFGRYISKESAWKL